MFFALDLQNDEINVRLFRDATASIDEQINFLEYMIIKHHSYEIYAKQMLKVRTNLALVPTPFREAPAGACLHTGVTHSFLIPGGR